ncbi:YqjF family protein [Frigoriflavimonas asaccharolytica]|uniref:DUF2071 domain-containing protein n=1 Tax=Frigoriflavimonas asaccharolytica TaxID=2735899 RepID=A0A8J8KAB1_9FLAO|nr:DUF2071 domain-containing protein [Frigoriflavimonas asaccharolytica]NRS91294.1 hypothetical protein [Frigoriflavimonas asaccharolytica]
MSFLKAQWKNLTFINYIIDPKILQPHVPKGTELDFYNGNCYVSVVGFLFEDVKMLGLKIPFHINFEEVNLRFYVKRWENNAWKRGVVFIQEIVPKFALTLVANILYNEHYKTLPMKHSIQLNENSGDFQVEWKIQNKWNSIFIKTENEPTKIELDSEEEFITEHYFGYTKVNENKTYEYEVKHPSWQQLKVLEIKLDIDFTANYGAEFNFLKDEKPSSVIFAIGSKVSIENKRTLRN